MAWNDPLTAHLLDFLYELDRSGLNMPMTIAGGFGLFLKRKYCIEHRIGTLFQIHNARSTEDIDLFVHPDILCNEQQVQSLLAALQRLN